MPARSVASVGTDVTPPPVGVVFVGVVSVGVVSVGVVFAGVVSVGVVGVVAVVTGVLLVGVLSDPLKALTSRIRITITAMIASTASTITIWRCASPSGSGRGG